MLDIEFFYFTYEPGRLQYFNMKNQTELKPPRFRKMTVTLPEEEWKRFVEAHPQPVQWIIEKIQSSLNENEIKAAK
jgi:hypothetical protein